MTPERKAELRQGVAHSEDCHEDGSWCANDCIHSNLDEMLDEIERLQGLVTEFYNAYVSLLNRTGRPGTLMDIETILHSDIQPVLRGDA